jgi:polyketide cyclase/dehydrase/lipid transport protein
MARIRVRTDIDAPPRRVWQEIRDVTTHTRWMEDAVAIRIVSPAHEGVSTTFECDTKVGPFRLLDVMEVTEWKPRRSMGIRHEGIVTGSGRFTLRRHRGGTRFTWSERLRFPLWVGGPVAAWLSRPVLRRVWRKNLANLKALVEGGGEKL